MGLKSLAGKFFHKPWHEPPFEGYPLHYVFIDEIQDFDRSSRKTTCSDAESEVWD